MGTQHTPSRSAGVILLVEDEDVLRKMYQRKLTAEGFTVLEANDGESGLEKALEHMPHLLITDIRLPRMSGYEMVKRLRAQNDWGARVPVVFLSNIVPSSENEHADIESMEPVTYLVKSNISLNELVEKAREYIEARY